MAFDPIVQASPKRPRSEILRAGPKQQINTLLHRNLNVTTILLLGALFQGLLVLLVPRIWTLLPTIVILGSRFADTLAITLKLRPNPYLKDVIHKKWTAIVPDTEGTMSDQPAEEKVAVLLLCLKVNHPLGFFAPNVKEVGDFARDMAIELDANAEHNGFLGQSEWNTTDTRGACELMLLSYWRSIDDIHAYSAGPLHTKAIKWWDGMVYKDDEGMKHVGIDHEIFEAPRSRWEKVSINFQPTRLGATSYLRKGDKLMGGIVDDQWISPIVEARGRLRTSRGRLNWVNNTGTKSGSGSGDEKY